MANSLDPDQAASIGAVWSGSTLFASILKFISNVRQLIFCSRRLQQTSFLDAFFLGALKAKPVYITKTVLLFLTCKRRYSNNVSCFQGPHMCRLVWAFAGRTYHNVGNLTRGSIMGVYIYYSVLVRAIIYTFMFASSQGSGETVRLPWLTWAFAVLQCDKCQWLVLRKSRQFGPWSWHWLFGLWSTRSI